VGLRDALLTLPTPLPTSLKCDWVLSAQAAGFSEIEVGAFGAPPTLPQLADTREVVEFAKTVDGIRVTAFVHDQLGAREAVRAGVDAVTIPFPWAVNSLDGGMLSKIMALIDCVNEERDRCSASCCIEVIFSDVFEQECLQRDVGGDDSLVWCAQSVVSVGAAVVCLADKHGWGTPQRVHELFGCLKAALPLEAKLGAHLHQTNAYGMGTVLAAAAVGVERFDATLGGVGGCAHNHQALGNMAAEAVAALFHSVGVETGLAPEGLRQFSRFLTTRPALASLFQAVAVQNPGWPSRLFGPISVWEDDWP